MAFVAVAALDFATIRSLLIRTLFVPNGGSLSLQILGFGTLPIANVLAVGLLIAYRHSARRQYLLGFEVYGALAMVFFAADVLVVHIGGWKLFGDDWVIRYLNLLLEPLSQFRMQGAYLTTPHIVLLLSVVAVWLSLPQLIFALIGGWLSLRSRYWWHPLPILAVVLTTLAFAASDPVR
jgi:hypothetical protein